MIKIPKKKEFKSLKYMKDHKMIIVDNAKYKVIQSISELNKRIQVIKVLNKFSIVIDLEIIIELPLFVLDEFIRKLGEISEV